MLCSRLSIGVNVCHDGRGVGWAVHMHIQPPGWMNSLESFAPHIFYDGFVNVFFVYYVYIFFWLIVLSDNKHKWQGRKQARWGKERQKFINQKITRIHNDKTPTSGIICDCFWKMTMVWVYRHNEAAKEVFITNQKKKGRNSLIFYLCGGLFMSAKS